MAIKLGSYSGSSNNVADILQGTSSGISLQGNTEQIQGNTQSVQGSSPQLQVTANPYNYSVGTVVGSMSQPQSPSIRSANTGGGTPSGGGYDPYAAQRAAQAQKEAEEAAKRAQLTSGIQKLIKDTMGIYDKLYGDVRGAAKSQNQLLNQRYNREVGALTDQFNQELPKIGEGFASRGAFHSSYRQGAEDNATKGFEGQIQGLGEQRAADAAKIGQFVREKEAEFGAQRSLVDQMRNELGQVEDVNELRSLQREMQQRIANLQAQRGGLGTREAYTQRLNQLAPTADRMGQLGETLSNIISGQAPAALKRSVAQQIIGSAGLSPDQERELLNQVTAQIG